MGLITVLLTMTYKVREISPSRESRMACDQVAELLAGDEAPLELEDELQISLPFEPRGGGTHTLCSACVPAKGGKAG